MKIYGKLAEVVSLWLKVGTKDVKVVPPASIPDPTDLTISLPAPPSGNTDTLVSVAAVQTLTGKTLTSPAINSPTGLVKGDVGLSLVDNTSDLQKPVSTLQAAADAAVQAFAVQRANHTGTQPASSITGLAAVATSGNKADILLDQVDNTSDATKNSATATLLNKTVG
jgi:hypothetical protein